ncbi:MULTISPECIES: C4-type zinc ribbon domain-containing protein [Atopobiaceae]|uniref:zinc ribbon domain-containing protein n=1 Tax=Atopobiaceae TaxID=1643824 RepID=UPI000B3A44D0|nr:MULTISPECIES: C4-type zinc ribbon domain-containing protein [Atopobiaceae]MCR8908738.1 C4-type zinc ribbon domain-containing protein [Thermophilibacter sp. ET337]OUO32644.1 hypothetical protein B5F85_05045 [Olsenella sp. An293]
MTEATALMRLQELDLELLKCASSLASMPQQARLKTIGLAARKVASELTGIVGQRKDAELELADTRADLAHYREKTAEVQALADAGGHTHREIRDFEQQLTSLAKRIEKCEFQIGPLTERLERLERAEKNARLTAERLEGERATTESALTEGSKALRSRIVELSRERERAAEGVSPEHLAAYEKARKRFKGLAVERLAGNVPSVCRVKLQPSSFHDLAHGDEITECPYCHRILITSEEGQA